MFDFLKKAVTGIVDKISGKKEAPEKKEAVAPKIDESKIEEEKAEETVSQNAQEFKAEEFQQPPQFQQPQQQQNLQEQEKPEIEMEELPETIEKLEAEKEFSEKNKEEEKEIEITENENFLASKEIREEKPKLEEYLEKKPELPTQKLEIRKPEKKPATPAIPIAEEIKEIPERKKIEEKAKPSIIKSVFSVFTGKIKIEKADIADFLDEFEIQLVEADVALEVAEHLRKSMESKLIGREIGKDELKSVLKSEIESTVLEMLPGNIDFFPKIRSSEKPYKIIFFGPNGSGKTTTIAKIANLMKENGLNVVVAASDTFRAAAIEQLQEHCEKLSIPLIKGNYQSDPSSVAFNAIEHAKAKNIDVVLIDTAGRLEIDTNLMRELEKIVRVSKPDLKVFIAESIMGNSIYDLAKEYHKMVGIDAAVLTKLDLDAKGGVAISLYKATSIPIIFVSTGQKYSEIELFDRKKITDLILSE